MGKYIKKTKGTGGVTVMEISQGYLGVRTRARTLALQRDDASGIQKTAASYLQLRSRRLEKPPFPSKSPPKPAAEPMKSDYSEEPSDSAGCAASTKSNARLGSASVNSARSRSISVSVGRTKPRPLENEATGATGKPDAENETGVEVSFGENMLDFDARESSRSIRETTPCSLMRNSEGLEAPGSTTRPTNQSFENNRRLRSESSRCIPTAIEMEEFFADAERQQQRRFTEKYNYDPVNDLPLPGRYEWIRLSP